MQDRDSSVKKKEETFFACRVGLLPSTYPRYVRALSDCGSAETMAPTSSQSRLALRKWRVEMAPSFLYTCRAPQ